MSTPPPLRRLALALTISPVAALALAGCGGGSEKKATAASTSTTVATASTTASSAAARTQSHHSSHSAQARSAPRSSTPVHGARSTAPAPIKGTSNARGTILFPKGTMGIASTAFPQGGLIPAKYTCDGANISPPLRWGNVPKNAAALFLFVVDETGAGTDGGIRWVVGDIDPHSSGVAEGQVPAGGVVGRTTAGTTGWAGICPPKGKAHLIEMVLYALHHPLKLSSGFNPTVAEAQFRKNTFASAVSVAAYRRP